MKTEQEQIEELEKVIAEHLVAKGWVKLPKDSVVLSREEYEMLANQYKNLEIKYSNLCDNYRLCKDANETLKRNVIITRKETAKEILLLLGKGFDETARKDFKDLQWYKQFCRELELRYGIDLFGKTEQVENSDKLEDEV